MLMLGGPISAQQLITVGVNMMDTVMLGQLNETVLAARSMEEPFENTGFNVSVLPDSDFCFYSCYCSKSRWSIAAFNEGATGD